MCNFSLQRLRRIYKILLSISIIIAGICLIAGCIAIYFSGDGYSSDIVGKTFSKIDIPVYLSLTLIVGDAVWELISPSTQNKKRVNKKVISTEQTEKHPTKKTTIIKLVVLCFALVLLVIGALFGGFNDVLTKAVNICTECIGLG